MTNEGLSSQAFTEYVLGTPIIPEAAKSPEYPLTEVSAEARAALYRTALRGLATTRHQMRRAGFDTEDWEPPRELLERVVPNFDLLGRRLAIMNNLERYAFDHIHGDLDHGLFDHQEATLEKITHYLLKNAINPAIPEGADLLDRLSKTGYLDLPTAYGKTVLIAKLCQAVGIGKPATEHDTKPLRALVLVPTLQIFKQTMGEDGRGGFGKFAPELNVTGVSSKNVYTKKYGLDGDVVVMTYSGLHEQMKRGFDHSGFDLVVCDESHRGLGPDINQTVRKVIRGKIALGFTATAEFPDGREVADVLPGCIDKMEIRDAIEDGVVNGAQVLWFASGEEIKIQNYSHAGFTEGELEPLLHSAMRNSRVEKLAKLFVAQGRRGVISCNPGKQCEHATSMANRLEGAEVISQETGETIRIRAAAVGNFQGKSENDAVLEAYNDGAIDVLTYVDMVNEGWDCDEVNFMILARPASKLLAIQRFGRGLRKSAKWPVTIYAEIVDSIQGKTSKLPYSLRQILTFAHKTPELGEVIASRRRKGAQDKSERDGTRKYERRPYSITLDSLPPDLRESCLNADNILVYQETVQSRESYGPPPEGWTALEDLCKIAGGRARNTVDAILSSKFQSGSYLNEQRLVRRYFEPAAKVYLESLPHIEKETGELEPGEVTLYGFSQQSGYHEHILVSTAAKLDIPLKGRNRKTPRGVLHHLTLEEQDKILEKIKSGIDKAADTDVSVVELTKRLGFKNQQSTNLWLTKMAITAKKKIPFGAEGLTQTWHVTGVEAAHAVQELEKIPIASPQHYTVKDLLVLTGLVKQTLNALIDELGLAERLVVHRTFLADGRHDFIRHFSPEDGKAILAEAERRKPPERSLALTNYCSTRGVSSGRVATTIEDHNLKVVKISTGSGQRTFLVPETISQLDALLRVDTEKVKATEALTRAATQEAGGERRNFHEAVADRDVNFEPAAAIRILRRAKIDNDVLFRDGAGNLMINEKGLQHLRNTRNAIRAMPAAWTPLEIVATTVSLPAEKLSSMLHGFGITVDDWRTFVHENGKVRICISNKVRDGLMAHIRHLRKSGELAK